MIPKIIHCFYDDVPIFKKGPDPVFRICYASWKRHLPDYEIKLWHDGLPEFQDMLKHSRFLRICYKQKMWAFVSDYVRLYALYHCGGVYLDTDVQLLKSFDPFLKDRLFCSIEGDIKSGRSLAETAVLGAEKGHPVIAKALELYNGEEIFEVDNLISPVAFTEVLYRELGFEKIAYAAELDQKLLDGFYAKQFATIDSYAIYRAERMWQDPQGLVQIYPSEIFCPAYSSFGEQAFTENTVTVHWNRSSWWKVKKKIYLLQSYRFSNPLRRFLCVHSNALANIMTALIPSRQRRRALRVKIKDHIFGKRK